MSNSSSQKARSIGYSSHLNPFLLTNDWNSRKKGEMPMDKKHSLSYRFTSLSENFQLLGVAKFASIENLDSEVSRVLFGQIY